MLISRFSCRRIASPPLSGTITSGSRGKSVPAHDLAQRGEIRRAARRGIEDGRDLAEEVGAEDARGDDCERLGIDLAPVVEVVDGAAGDKERLAGSEVGRRALDRPGQYSLEPVD